MIAAVRGNITNLRVNFAGSRPATKSLALTATWATASSTNLSSMPVLPIVVVRSSPTTFLIASAQRVQRTSGTHRQRRNPHGVCRPTSPDVPRFPPLEVCGRRPQSAWRRHHRPASENLHNNGNHQTKDMRVIEKTRRWRQRRLVNGQRRLLQRQPLQVGTNKMDYTKR